MKRWSEKHVKDKLKAGTIRNYSAPPKKKLTTSDGQPLKAVGKRSKELDWIKWNLWYWANQHALTLEEEHCFASERKFRFDFAFPAIKLAIEYEGLMSEKSGHTTVSGYTKDTDKYNLAQRLGWKVIRFTALNYKNLIRELDQQIAA